jgi:hypothetical protein
MVAELYGLPRLVWDIVNKQRGSYALIGASFVAAGVVERKWGKVAAACFLFGAGLNYPLLFGHLSKLSYRDSVKIIQLIVIAGVPFFYFHQPSLAPVYIPILCMALFISIIKQRWDDAESDKVEAEQIKKIREQDLLIEKSFAEFEITAQRLENGIEQILGQESKVDEIKNKEDLLSQAALGVQKRVDEKLKKLKEMVGTLAVLCEKARKERSTRELLTTVSQAEKKLETVQVEYALSLAGLQKINTDLSAVKVLLKGVVEGLSEDQRLLREKIVVLQDVIEKLLKK